MDVARLLAGGALAALEAVLAVLGAAALLAGRPAAGLACLVALAVAFGTHARMLARPATPGRERRPASDGQDAATWEARRASQPPAADERDVAEAGHPQLAAGAAEPADAAASQLAPAPRAGERRADTGESALVAARIPAPAGAPGEAPAELPGRPGFDFDAFSTRICLTADPWAELRLFVEGVRSRLDAAAAVSPLEHFCARMLEEAGLLADDVELPAARLVLLASSDLFYLRINDRELPWLARERALAIEAALNAARLSAAFFDDPDAHVLEEHYQLLQRLSGSICAQSPNLAEGVPPVADERPDTEWAVRLGISTAIESLRLPQRLVASWRVNVADGNVAIELDLPGEARFPGSASVPAAGLVPTTRSMRRRAAADYALRLALLVAACAFRCSERISHVWVAGIVDGPARRWCALSVDFDRPRFARLDLADLGDLAEVYRTFAARLRYEGHVLRPVEQGFALDEFRFCPPRRYESVGLSSRRLRGRAVASLGTDHVSGLAINEGDKRRLIAGDIMSALGDSTEGNVRAILEMAGDDPDPSVRAAAERTVSKLIAGTLADEPIAVGEEFAAGDALTQAVLEAQRRFHASDPHGAARVLRAALSDLDAAGTYADSPSVEWRYFPSYVNRTMYNRLCATAGRTLMLVPDAYFDAHLLLSVALLALGRGEEALAHAERLVELSPLDARAHLHQARCLEALGRGEEAVAVLADLLEGAHEPQSLGMGYYRMAFFQWQRGNVLAAQACYQRALTFMPQATPLVAMELTALALQNPASLHEELSDDEAESVLAAAGVPIAPTERVSETLLDAARAALDAEIFPVARGFLSTLAAFSGDDILMGVLRSIEDEPGW